MSDTPQQVWHPRHNPWLITLTVMMAVFMEVLDTSIANIALPHIAGGLSATPEEATWVLTSYLVSNAIILPMTGWLGNYLPPDLRPPAERKIKANTTATTTAITALAHAGNTNVLICTLGVTDSPGPMT